MNPADALRRLFATPIAHRGLHGGGMQPVENSIAAAEAAIAGGFGIECDIQLSRDGEAMVFHDERLERLTSARGRLDDQDAAVLSSTVLAGGEDRIPTLADFLSAIGGRAPLVIEIKSVFDSDMRLTERAVALLEDYPGVVALESFDPAIVGHARRLGARGLVGLVGPAEDRDGPDPAFVEGCDFLSWKLDDLASIAARYPRVARSTWTVRTREQQDSAAACNAQIVFEGFVPYTIR